MIQEEEISHILFTVCSPLLHCTISKNCGELHLSFCIVVRQCSQECRYTTIQKVVSDSRILFYDILSMCKVEEGKNMKELKSMAVPMHRALSV